MSFTQNNSISILNDDTLMEIFKYLNPLDRKVAKLVCHTWTELLSSSSKFEKQSKLELNHCHIAREYPPFTILSSTTRSFYSVELGENVHYKDKEVVCELLEHIGSATKELNVIRTKCPAEFFTKFPVLEQLTCDWRDLTNIQVPQTLKTIVLYSVARSMPKDVVDVLDSFRGRKDLKVVARSVEFCGGCPCCSSRCSEFLTFNELLETVADKLNVQRFFVSGVDLQKTRRIELVHITSFDAVITFQKLKNLLPDLKSFLNLEEIAVKLEPNTGCFFGHHVVKHEGIRSFNLQGKYSIRPCLDCLIKVVESFPNITTFIAENLPSTVEILHTTSLRLENLVLSNANLFYLSLKSTKDLTRFNAMNSLKLSTITKDEEGFLLKFPQMPCLKNLTLNMDDAVNAVELKHLITLCPNLRTVWISYRLDEDFFVSMVKALPYLQHVSLDSLTYEHSLVDRLDQLLPHTKNLRDLNIPEPTDGHLRLADKMKFFHEIPTLRQLNGFSYAERFEVIPNSLPIFKIYVFDLIDIDVDED